MKKYLIKSNFTKIVCVLVCAAIIYSLFPLLKPTAYTEGTAGKLHYNSEIVSAVCDDNGKVSVTWNSDGQQYIPFAQFYEPLNANVGIHFETGNINMKDYSGYSLVYCIGNTSNNQSWDKSGFQIVYTTAGKFYVYNSNIDLIWRDPYVAPSADSNAIKADIEPLTSKGCSIDVKLVAGTYYKITVINGEYKHEYQLNTSAVKLSSYGTVYASCTLASNNNPPKKGSSLDIIMTNDADYGTSVPPTDYIYTGEVYKFKEKTEGLKVTRLASGYAYERVSYGKKVIIGEKPVKFDISDIEAYASSYTLAFSFGSGEYSYGGLNYAWCDNKGIMLLYNNAGDVTFIETTTGVNNDPNTATVLAHGKITPSNSLTIEVSQNDDYDYIVSVNGEKFTVSSDSLNASEELNISFGVMSGYTYDSLTDKVKNLMYWQNNFINGDISFIVKGITGSEKQPEEKGNTVPPQNYAVVAADDNAQSFEFSEKDGKVLVKSTKNQSAWERFGRTEKYDITDEGLSVSISELKSKSKNYSFVIFLNDTCVNGWNDKNGCMIFYDRDGDFAIVKTTVDEVDVNKVEVLATDKLSFKNSIDFNFKLKDDKYIVTFNGNEYKFDTSCIYGSEEVYLTFGVMSGFDVDTKTDTVANIDFLYPTKGADLTFTIDSIKGKLPEDESVTKGSAVPPDDYNVVGENYRFKNTDNGLMITHLATGAAYERVEYKVPYFARNGIKLTISDIISKSKDYSIAVCIAPNAPLWCDKKCLMVYYDAGGNLSLVACTGEVYEDGGTEDPNNAEVLASTKLESFINSLTINISVDNGKYLFDINGMKATVDGAYLSNAELLAFTYGVNSAYKLSDGDISDLQYWQLGFKNKSVSFTVNEIDGESGTDDPIEGTPINLEASPFKLCGDKIFLLSAENGTKVVHTAEAGAWERVIYKNKFSTQGDGLSFNVTDINCKANNYAMVVKFGTEEGWYGTRGYEIHYGMSGNFMILATDKTQNNPNLADVAVNEVREPLGKEFSLKVALNGINYDITVNGKTYTIPAQNLKFPIKNAREVFLEFGIMNDAKLGDIDYWTNTFKNNNVSFVVTSAKGMLAEDNLGANLGLKINGNHWSFDNSSGKVRFTFDNGGTAKEFVSIIDSFSTKNGGIDISLCDIESFDSNYSVVVMFSDSKNPWYDCTGYMLTYGKSGNFSIIATDNSVISPNKSEISVKEKREALGKNLTVNARLQGKNLIITVNGKEYTVLAKNKTYGMTSAADLYVSFGIFEDKPIGDLNLVTTFLNYPVSFTMGSVSHNDRKVAVTDVTEDKPKEEEKHQTAETDNTNADTPETVKESNNTLLIIVIIAAVIAALGIVGTVLIIKKKKIA